MRYEKARGSVVRAAVRVVGAVGEGGISDWDREMGDGDKSTYLPSWFEYMQGPR
jgi:hypothetical protein